MWSCGILTSLAMSESDPLKLVPLSCLGARSAVMRMAAASLHCGTCACLAEAHWTMG